MKRTEPEPDLRLRAAWLYYGHQLTQAQVAGALGVSRSTVLRLLDDVRARREIRFWIEGGLTGMQAVATQLEQVTGIGEVILVPAGPDVGGVTRATGLALGRLLTDLVSDGMTIGAGWGRTLSASLQSFTPKLCPDCRVVSLLGSGIDPLRGNPMEFAWQLAGLLGAVCHPYSAPVVVNSAGTRRILLEECGLNRIEAIARELDLAVFSVGDIGVQGTSLARDLIPADDYDALVECKTVADVMCNFLDAEGREIDHPIRERIMTTPLSSVGAAKIRVLAAAGHARAPAILAAIRRLQPTHLVTDEDAAQAVLGLWDRKDLAG